MAHGRCELLKSLHRHPGCIIFRRRPHRCVNMDFIRGYRSHTGFKGGHCFFCIVYVPDNKNLQPDFARVNLSEVHKPGKHDFKGNILVRTVYFPKTVFIICVQRRQDHIGPKKIASHLI